MQKPPQVPDKVRQLLAELGPRWGADVPGNIRKVVEAFSDVLKAAPREGVTVRRNVAYGSHERQQFDIYAPMAAAGTMPALLFVHGGAFVNGNRNRTDEIYANVLYYFARHGIVGVNIGYRLAGDAAYPGATEDIAAVVAWVRSNAADLGVDPDRIFLMGHSAGCAHAGSYAYDKRRHPPAGPGLRGLIVVSGRVRAETAPDNPNAKKVEAYYGTTDPAVLDDVSPVSHVSADSVPTFVAWGEYENPLIDKHCAELVFRLGEAKRRTPPLMWLKGHTHTSMIAHFNTAEDDLGRAILDFIDNPR